MSRAVPPPRAITLAFWLAAAVIVGILAQAQAPAPDAKKDAAAPRVVNKKVLPDGTVQVEYADGTTKQIPSTPSRPASPTEAPEATESAPASARNQVALPPQPPPWLKDPDTDKVFLQATREYYSYLASGLQHRRRVFEWQLLSSRIIFATVLLLVGSGIVFAALQFRAGLKRKTPDARDAATELDLTTTSIKVSSPILGVIILIISLGFFYLYLVYVYPISELI